MGKVTLIDKTKKAPVFIPEPIPSTFKTTLDKERYWATEQTRWLEGYQGLPATLYYKATQGWIKDRVAGGLPFLAETREVDLMVHEWIAERRRKKEMGGIVKPRGYGFSTDIGILANYFMRVYPGSNTVITSRDQGGIQTIFQEKVMPCYEGMPADIRPDLVNKNDTKQSCFLRTQIPVSRNGETVYTESTIYLRETSEKPSSPNNLSGKGALFGAYDEFPLHPRREELLKSSIEIYRNTRTKELDGFLLWGGTVEETLTNADVSKFKSMIDDKDIWKCGVLFIPFWMQMFTINGRPDKKKADEWWKKEFDRLSKSPNPTLLTAFIRNNPRSLEDIFESADGGRWEEDVALMIKDQRKRIANDPPMRKTGKFFSMAGMGTFTEDKKGSSVILEEPRPGVEYFSVIDGVATGSETSSGGQEGSKVASLIIKGYDPDGGSYSPVSLYFERPKTVEQSYISIVAQAKYFNRFDGFKWFNAEANASTADHFSTFLKTHGMGKYIKMRRSLNGSEVKKNQPFFYVNDDTRAYQFRRANIFLRKYLPDYRLAELIEQMLTASDENADILDAWLMLMLGLPDNFDEPVKEKKHRKRMIPVFRTDADGRKLMDWKEV